jgi:PRTRC genetic system protein B
MEMIYTTSVKPEQLQFVIAGYDETISYHEYDPQGCKLGAGKPLTIDTLRSIIKVTSEKFVDFETTYNFSGLIPRNVLRFFTDEKKIIWWTPAQKRRLLFQKSTKIKTGVYPVPILLWKLESNRLFVWALKSQPKSLFENIFNAPFFNTSSSGLICMGNAKFTSDSMDYMEVMKMVETAFFNSYFTHSAHNNLIKSDYVKFMQEQQKSGPELFPVKQLFTASKTINTIIAYDNNGY